MRRRRYIGLVAGAGSYLSLVGRADASRLDIEFDYTSTTVGRGEILSVPVVTNRNNRADVQVGEAGESNYEVLASLTDTDTSRVVMEFNVYLSGFDPIGDAFSVSDSDDSVSTDVRTQSFGNPIEPGQYSLTLFDPATGDAVDLRSFTVEERTPGTSIAQWSTGVDVSLPTYDSIQNKLGDGIKTVSDADDIPNGARVLYQLRIDGLSGVITAYGDDIDHGTLSTLIDNGHVSFAVEQSNEPPNTPPKILDLNASSDAISLWYSREDDQLWIGLDMNGLVFTRSDTSDTFGVAPDDEFRVTFAVTDQYVGGTDESASITFGVDRRRLSLTDSRNLTVYPEPGQAITGTTSSPGGTEYEVEIRGPNLIDRANVTAGGDGTFETTFDLSSLSPGDELETTLKRDGSVVDNETYVLAEPEGPPTASITFDDQQRANGVFVVLSSLELSDGGFVTIRNGDASGRILGVSRYLASGQYTDFAVTLDQSLSGGANALTVVVHTDDGDREFESADVDPVYTVAGGAAPVADSATVTVPQEETTTSAPTTTTTTTADSPEPTTTDAPTLTTTDAPTLTTTDVPTLTTTDVPTPTTTDTPTPTTAFTQTATPTPRGADTTSTTAAGGADTGGNGGSDLPVPMPALLAGAGVGTVIAGGALYRFLGGSDGDGAGGDAAAAGSSDGSSGDTPEPAASETTTEPPSESDPTADSGPDYPAPKPPAEDAGESAGTASDTQTSAEPTDAAPESGAVGQGPEPAAEETTPATDATGGDATTDAATSDAGPTDGGSRGDAGDTPADATGAGGTAEPSEGIADTAEAGSAAEELPDTSDTTEEATGVSDTAGGPSDAGDATAGAATEAGTSGGESEGPDAVDAAAGAGVGTTGSGGGDRAAQFVDQTPAVASAEFVSQGLFDKYVGVLEDGTQNVLFSVLSPESDTQAARTAFRRSVQCWQEMGGTDYVASIGTWDIDPRPWVGVLAVQDTLADYADPLAPSLQAPVATAVTEAVRTANEYGYNHPSLAPEHVHVAPGGTPVAVVTEWGYADAVRAAAGKSITPTPYTPPEQLSGGTASPATDVYRSGAVLYRALSGRPPVTPDGDVASAIQRDGYTPLGVDHVPAAVDDVLARSMATDPAARQNSPSELRNALLDLLR